MEKVEVDERPRERERERERGKKQNKKGARGSHEKQSGGEQGTERSERTRNEKMIRFT